MADYYRDLIARLKAGGYEFKRQGRGDHEIWWNPGTRVTVVVDSQWGDEGKGKIVDWLSEQADIVVRFQGGHNAGHTLVVNGATYKLSLLPSGVVREGKLSVIGNGVVLDPNALLNEIEKLASQGVTVSPDNLRIAENATLILPLHRDLEEIRESANTHRIG